MTEKQVRHYFPYLLKKKLIRPQPDLNWCYKDDPVQKFVPPTGFEPMIFGMRTRRPKPN